MGSGPFVFVERTPGSVWVGKRFDGYFRQGHPYLDGFRNVLFSSSAMVNALQAGQVDAEFRGITPADRERLTQVAGDRIAIQEAPQLSAFMLSFNTQAKPFDDIRVRKALHMAIDRWHAVAALSKISPLRAAGGFLRPGFELAGSDAELQAMPGMGTDIEANRAEAKRLLKEAGVPNLAFKLTGRPISPYPNAAVFLIDQWRRIGVTVEQLQVETAPYFAALTSGSFEAIIDFSTEYADEPNLQWVKYISMDRAPPPLNSARYVDREIDALFDAQSREPDVARRKALLRQMESRVIDRAGIVPLFWFQRIVATSKDLRGWPITPSHLLNQDLADVWLAR